VIAGREFERLNVRHRLHRLRPDGGVGNLEREFEELLSELKPSEELFAMAVDIFRDVWSSRVDSEKTRTASLRQELSRIERKVEQLFDRIVDGDSETLIKAYEKRIRELECEKAGLTDKVRNCGRPLLDFDSTFRTSFEFLANPCNLWDSERLEDRRAVLKLVFAEKRPYHRKDGFRTPKTTLPFKVLGDFCLGKYGMAHPKGFEPLTPRFVV
jgi:site-specific DNA recombinase